MDQELGTIMLHTTMETFVTYSISIILFAFLVKLFTNTSFESLKIISTIIYVSGTLYFSFVLYKADTEIKLEKIIIDVKTSTLTQPEKDTYVKNVKNSIESITSIDIKDLVFGLTKFIFFGMVLLLFKDIYKFVESKRSIKPSKKKQTKVRLYGNFKY